MSLLVELQSLLKRRVLQLPALACLFASLGALNIASRAPVLDADVWWHLKVGEWIVQHHTFPHVGILSRTAATKPWMAYSWGYEVLLSRAFAWFGLMGLAWFGILLTVAVVLAFFWLLFRLSGRFWLSWMLCGMGGLSFLFNVLPRPVFLSMILYSVTLMLLLEARRSGGIKRLFWLPLLFLTWANFHIQFVYGLLLLVLFLATEAAKRMFLNTPVLPIKTLLAVSGASLLACCVGPYGWSLFPTALGYSRAKFPYLVLQELQSIDFKHPSDFVLVVLVMGAFAVLILRKEREVFPYLILVVTSVMGFRVLRDAWLPAIAAAAFLASGVREQERASVIRWREWAIVGVLTVAGLFIAGGNLRFNSRELDFAISQQYPVDAANYLRRNPVAGPLYNEFAWGGFLTWYLPQYPVAIDGRTDLYGDEIDFMTYRSASGDYASDTFLQEANVVLIPTNIPLAEALGRDPEFRAIYRDRLAVIFARH